MATARFQLGRLIATPCALAALEESGEQPGTFISRYAAAYHRNVSQWHPDKLETMAPELKDYATRQTVYEAERMPAIPECSAVRPSRSFSDQDSVQDRGALPLKKASTNGRRDVYYTS